MTPPLTTTLDHPALYSEWVERVAAALHEDCELEWQAIAVVDPSRAVTMHMADAHYGRAHDLVRRLNLSAQPPPPAEALRLLRELVDRWFLYSDDLPKADVMNRLARLEAFHASAGEARRYLASTEEGDTVSNPLTPSPALLAKIGSGLVHVEELLSPTGHHFDKAALTAVLNDPEVTEWLAAMRAMAMLPVRR